MGVTTNKAQVSSPLRAASPYVEAVGVVLLMAEVHLSNPAFIQGGARYTLLLIGVSYGVWRGGKGPATLALFLTALLGAYVFSPPKFSLQIAEREDQIALILYILLGVVIIVFGEAQRTDRQRVLEREKELRIAYEKLAAANKSLETLVERRTADLDEIRRFVAEDT